MSETTPATPTGYKYMEYLGAGGQGTVCKVQRNSDGKILAMKTVRLTQKYDPSALKQEFAIHQSLHNRYIVNVESSVTDEANGFLYIFMELCARKDLDEYIHRHMRRKQAFPERQIWRMLAQIATAVDACHASNVLHRDIKPNNLFLTDDNEIRLGDFGLAAILKDGETIDDFAGTSEYAAPEVHNEQPQGRPADCWGIGVVLFELCNLSYFVNGSRKGNSIKKEVNAGPSTKIPSYYSYDLQRVVKSLLSIDATKRMTTAKLLKIPQVLLELEHIKAQHAGKTLAACQEELVVMRQELLATQERLKMEEEKARELRDDVNLTKKQNDELHVLLDQRDEYILAADNAKRAERQRKIKQDEKAKQRSRLDPFFSSQVGSPMRKVQEARQKLAKDYERKGDEPVPPLPSFYARFPVADAAQVKSSVTVALRSCLKKPLATQALAFPDQSTVDLRDPPEDVRSPRKNRDLRRVHKVAHMYTPTETLPLIATLASAIPMCPATP